MSGTVKKIGQSRQGKIRKIDPSEPSLQIGIKKKKNMPKC